ncbi:MAG: T9SS type A sorting domain-containing protein [bacterium]|nr:T9SS type A sorting domain-containing protein [bacterium]
MSVELPQAGNATINVYDVQGRLVRTLVHDYLLPGSHRFSFNGSDIGSGTYFVRLDANKTQNVKKMVLVK